MLKIDILTIFPKMFSSAFAESIVKRAQEQNLVKINIYDLRDWTVDKHRSIDAPPYGGGPGMVMRIDVIDKAVQALKLKALGNKPQVILLDTKGKIYNQEQARRLAKNKHLIFIAGHYEGIDHRVHKHIADKVISIGPYVLTGGELPTMVVIDSVVRLVPHVLGNPKSLLEESYSSPNTDFSKKEKNKSHIASLEYPQYTRPAKYKKWQVPKILLSGNHKKINQWRKNHSSSVS